MSGAGQTEGVGSNPQTNVRLTDGNRAWIKRYAADQGISQNTAINEAVALLRRERGG